MLVTEDLLVTQPLAEGSHLVTFKRQVISTGKAFNFNLIDVKDGD